MAEPYNPTFSAFEAGFFSAAERQMDEHCFKRYDAIMAELSAFINRGHNAIGDRLAVNLLTDNPTPLKRLTRFCLRQPLSPAWQLFFSCEDTLDQDNQSSPTNLKLDSFGSWQLSWHEPVPHGRRFVYIGRLGNGEPDLTSGSQVYQDQSTARRMIVTIDDLTRYEHFYLSDALTDLARPLYPPNTTPV